MAAQRHRHNYDPTNGRCQDCGRARCRCGNRPYHRPNCVTLRMARDYALQTHDPVCGAWAGLSSGL